MRPLPAVFVAILLTFSGCQSGPKIKAVRVLHPDLPMANAQVTLSYMLPYSGIPIWNTVTNAQGIGHLDYPHTVTKDSYVSVISADNQHTLVVFKDFGGINGGVLTVRIWQSEKAEPRKPNTSDKLETPSIFLLKKDEEARRLP